MNEKEIHDVDSTEEIPAQDDGLYVEELPEQTDLAIPAAAGTGSSVSTTSTFTCPSSLATAACVSSAAAA